MRIRMRPCWFEFGAATEPNEPAAEGAFAAQSKKKLKIGLFGIKPAVGKQILVVQCV